MAQAMAIVANGGTFYQTRLVQQVQTVDNEIVTAYQGARERRRSTLRHGHGAIAHRDGRGGERRRLERRIRRVWITCRSQEKRERRNGVRKTRSGRRRGLPDLCRPIIRSYAFAALYESEVGSNVHGGSAAAPMIGEILRDVFNEAGLKATRRSHRHRKKTTTFSELSLRGAGRLAQFHCALEFRCFFFNAEILGMQLGDLLHFVIR